MSDIYDRAKWPTPEANPLIQLVTSGEEWISNKALVEAIGLVNSTQSKSAVGHYRDFLADFGETETKIARTTIQGIETGQRQRFFSVKAAIIIAFRARTVNSLAFRDWLASRVAEEFAHG